MAAPEINPPADNAHADELPPMMPLGQPGAHGADPNGDAGWLATQAMSEAGQPTHHDQSYTGMTTDPPGAGVHAAKPYDSYKHEGR